MCLLVFMNEGATPDMDGLLRASHTMSDGFGFAISTDKGILVEQDMDFDVLSNKFLDARKAHQGPGLFHLRWATHGTTNKKNCHPFFLGGDRNTVVAHNGIMDVKIPESDNRSDSKVFAEDIMPAIGGILALDDENYFRRLEDWAKGNRLVFLTQNEDALKPFYIVNEDEGHWVDGVWYSNYAYEPLSYYPSYRNYSWGRNNNGWSGKGFLNSDEYEYEYKWDNDNSASDSYTKPSMVAHRTSNNDLVKFVYSDGFAIQDGEVRTHYNKDGTVQWSGTESYQPDNLVSSAKWSVSEGRLLYPLQTVHIPAVRGVLTTHYDSSGRTVVHGNKETRYDRAGKVLYVTYNNKVPALREISSPRIATITPINEYNDEAEIFDEHDSLSSEFQELFDFVIPFEKPNDGFLAICNVCQSGENIPKEHLIYTTHCKKCDSCYHCESNIQCDCWDDLMATTW